MNKPRQIVIIGCGAGGGTAAQFARKTDRTASITIVERGPYTQYSKCGLPYAIAGIIPAFHNLIEFSEEWFTKERIEVLLGTTVDEINMEQRVVRAKKGKEGIEKTFDSLILATGANPWIPPIENIQVNGCLLSGVFVVRTIDDGKQIIAHMKKGKHATIIGAGLIGLEMADALHQKGMIVTVVEALPSILANTIDDDMSEQVLQSIQEKITVYTNHLAIRIEKQKDVLTSLIIKEKITHEEKRIQTDLLIIATGTKPEITLAKTLGCAIGKTGGISVNGKSETSIRNVYAVGDCTEYNDYITKEPVGIGLGSIVVRQGIAAGINAAGGVYSLPAGVLLSRTSDFFGVEIAAVGPMKHAVEHLPVISGKYKGSSRPEYFPNGEPIMIKVAAHKDTGELLYAQAVGSNAAQRINTFACAILCKSTIEEFRKLETTYAPPIAPTLDAVTLACDVVALKVSRKRRDA